MFHDIHLITDEQLTGHRVPGADFDEATYADDTTCISKSLAAMNKFIETTKNEGLNGEMELNKSKYEVVTTTRMQEHTSQTTHQLEGNKQQPT